MKTTVEISDSLLLEAKQTAATLGVSLKEIIEQGLRLVVRENSKPKSGFRLRDGSVGGHGVALEDASWPAIRSLLYEGRGE